jgi:4-hydroxythreonine-4-phosphate dehydrogenase
MNPQTTPAARRRADGNRLPTIGVLLGDPSGVGPEMAVRLLSRSEARQGANLVIIGSRNVLAAGERVAGMTLDPLPIDSLDSPRFEPGRVSMLEIEAIADSEIEPGRMTEASGRYVLRMLNLAAQAAAKRQLDGVVFAPLNKGAMRVAGLEHEDEMRLLQSLLQVDGFVCEFNVTGALWTSRVTSHILISEVAAAISGPGIEDAIAILDRTLKASGVEAPRIAVAGLNPHAGDGGSIGREEIDVIAPAVERMRARGVDAKGPLPADTIFIAARDGAYDGVVSMYHDQGQIAMKLLGFDTGVTVLGGLPVPFTTCASGTAFDIVGRGIVRIEGLAQALALNKRMAARDVTAAA